jgi:hypothetical protein
VTENPWALYQRQPSFVWGFHGTDARVVNAVVERDIPHLDESKDSSATRIPEKEMVSSPTIPCELFSRRTHLFSPDQAFADATTCKFAS